MAVNIKTFVRTGDLFPGGAAGITLLITRSARIFFNVQLPYTLVNIILNAIPVYIGFRFIGKKFTLFSCWVILLAGFLVDIIPGYVITEDILLITIFGGIINGLVISICLLMNATTGGTDFISIYLSEKKGMDAFNIILVGNAVVLLIAGLLFGWDRALYSIIFQYVTTTVIHVLYRKYQQITLFIVTDHPNEVCEIISKIKEKTLNNLENEKSFMEEFPNPTYAVMRLDFLTESSEEKHYQMLIDLYKEKSLVKHLMEVQKRAIDFMRKEKPKMMEAWKITDENHPEYKAMISALKEMVIKEIVEA